MLSNLFALHLNARDYMLPCMNKKIFGFDCPGCGMQRAVHLLFQGDFVGAFKMYPAIYPLILFFSAILINNFWKFDRGNKTITFLGGLSALTIVINYIIKLSS